MWGEERGERTNDNATKSIVKRRKKVAKTKTRDSEHEERLTKVKERTLTEGRLEYPLSAYTMVTGSVIFICTVAVDVCFVHVRRRLRLCPIRTSSIQILTLTSIWLWVWTTNAIQLRTRFLQIPILPALLITHMIQNSVYEVPSRKTPVIVGVSPEWHGLYGDLR